MVKSENSVFSGPGPGPGPDVPPGFPPKTCSSFAVENQNGHAQFQTPDFSAEQPPRRATRKRSRPNFYKPPSRRQPLPAATPRRRGRPPKARLVSQFSNQEPQSINNNRVSSTLLRSPEEQMTYLVTSVQMSKEQLSSRGNHKFGEHGSQVNISPSPNDPVGQASYMARDISDVKKRARTIERPAFCAQDFEETLLDIRLTEEAPRPVSGCKRVQEVGFSNKISDGIDPKILQHVANALQYACLDGKKVTKSRYSEFDKDLAHMLKAINRKHGDITQDCSLESDCMKTLVVLGICKVVQDLEKKQLKDVDVSSLDSYYPAVRDAKNMKVNVQWLHNRLDEIKDAVNSSSEAKEMVNERNRLLESVDRKKKELLLRRAELERLKSEVQDIEEQLAQEEVVVQELNIKFTEQISKISQFQHTYLMDGLL